MLHNHTETVIRDLHNDDGELVVSAAVIQRTVSEYLIGINGQTLNNESAALHIATQPKYKFYAAQAAMRSQKVIYGVFEIMIMPMDACINVITQEEKSPEGPKFELFRHITPDQTKPRARFEFTSNEYKFFLAIGPTGFASYMWIKNTRTMATYCMGLPNTWEDGRACLGDRLDGLISKEGALSHRNIFAMWEKSQYNNHIVSLDNDTTRYFWRFNRDWKWMPLERHHPVAINNAITEATALL